MGRRRGPAGVVDESMDAFEHGPQRPFATGNDELGQDLVDHGADLGQLRQHLGRQRLELGSQAAAVRVEPEAAALEAAGQVHLGDPVERAAGPGTRGRLWRPLRSFVQMLWRSSRMPQSAASATAATKAPSAISSARGRR